MKGTMDPEGARLLTYSLYAYGKPRLLPIHKYSSLRSAAQATAGTQMGVRATVVTAGQCMHAELTSGHGLASYYNLACTPVVYANELAN